ncbi:MAG: TetR family transcriptional regulator [Thermomicrobiales bacterium]
MESTSPSSTPRRNAPLSRSQVLAAAIDLADRDGLDAVSMRKLAEGLGVVPMALYKHVANKDDLIAGMIDTVVASYPSPPPGAAWRDAIRGRMLGAREALGEHPWLRTAIEGATIRTPVVLAYMNALCGDFVAGGFTYDLTHYAMHALGYRIWGFSPEAFSSAPPPPPATPKEHQAMVAMMTATYPHIVAIALDTAARNPAGGCDEDGEFIFILDLLLDAFQRLRDAGWSSSDPADTQTA